MCLIDLKQKWAILTFITVTKLKREPRERLQGLFGSCDQVFSLFYEFPSFCCCGVWNFNFSWMKSPHRKKKYNNTSGQTPSAEEDDVMQPKASCFYFEKHEAVRRLNLALRSRSSTPLFFLKQKPWSFAPSAADAHATQNNKTQIQ